MTFRPLHSGAVTDRTFSSPTAPQLILWLLTAIFAPLAPAVDAATIPSQHREIRQDSTTHFRARIAVSNQTVNGKPISIVTIDEQPALSFQTTSGGVGPAQRALVTAQRLQYVVNSPDSTVMVGSQPLDAKNWVVTLQGGSLVTVTAEEAAAHKTTAAALARSWQASIQRLLTEIPIHPAQSEIVVPVGEDRSMRIGGSALATDIAVQISDAQSATASFDPSTRLLTIKGMAPGQVSLVLRSDVNGPAAAQVTVDVMKYAAHVSSASSVVMTGSPAPPELLQRAFYTALANAVDAEPEATVHLIKKPEFKWPLYEGHSTQMTVPIKVDGAGLLPVVTKTVLTLKNQAVTTRKASTLLYSNDPEQVTGPQTLFSSRIYPDIPARLDYHHQNISNGALGFHVQLENPQAAPLSVLVYAGVSLPGVDTIQVGRRAGAAFMNAVNNGTGIVLTIPGYSVVPIVTQRLPSLNTVSGLIELHTISGNEPVTVTVYTDDDDPPSPVSKLAAAVIGESWYVAPPEALRARPKPTSDSAVSVFRWPHLDLDAEYDVGGPWAYLRLGHKDQIKDATGLSALDGNYGADYNFTVTLKNPGELPRIVGFYFGPEAGTAAGCFRVDNGPMVEFDPTSPPEEPLIQKVTLAAGETRVVKIWTIPLNGSYYPASIMVHAL